VQKRVVVALMLRDIKTRFGSSEWGFLITIAWPLSHIVLLIVLNSALGRTVPFGESPALFFATGVVPYLAFAYMTRFIMLGIVLNKPMLAFPIVKVTDIIIARVIVEVLNAGVIMMIVVAAFAILGIDCWPDDLIQAAYAMLAMMLLGVGFGILNAVVAALYPFWVTGFALVQLVLWMLSGVLYIPDELPAEAQYYLSFNPALQGVEWFRSAYYPEIGTQILDRNYMLAWALGTVVVGLLLERATRGKVLM
jgi:capsular polysaccharide transport system permease protein